MRTAPGDFGPGRLRPLLRDRWGLAVARFDYQPVGFGSHHWTGTSQAGRRWFVTADDLAVRRHYAGEPAAAALARLRAALAAAADLRDSGVAIAVPPVAARDGELAVPAGGRYAVAVYPFLDGRSFSWGDFTAPGHREALLDLVVAVHTAPAAARRRAGADDFSIPHRDELTAALRPGATVPDCGPWAGPAARLLAGHAAGLARGLARYDALARSARRDPAGPGRRVLTHGEPHPGNTMLTADGWRLIDWDTALVAPPERDLWDIDPGDGSLLRRYAAATGTQPRPALLELYRLRWDLADIAESVSQFRAPHGGSEDDAISFGLLAGMLARTAR